MILTKILLLAVSYLLGSLSFAYLFARLIRGVDIRTVGSGNPGATNAARLLGVRTALCILVLDALKGWAVAVTVPLFIDDTSFLLLCGLAVIVGHNWPVFLGFKGGKGVATTLGFFLGVAPLPTVLLLAGVAAVILLTRYVSLGSIMGSIAIPLFMLFSPGFRHDVLYGVAICLVILLRHLPNINRLLNGTESRLDWKQRSL